VTSVAEAYAQLRHQPSDIREHLDTFVALTKALDAQRVCELGVRSGVSTIAWLHGLNGTGGHLWAVDIDPATVEHQRLTFVQGDDCSPEVLGQIPDDLDIVLVDSSHLYVHTVREIELYAPKLAPGGCMVFHDVDIERFDHHPDDEPPFPVRKAVEEAAHELGWQVDWASDTCGWDAAEGFNGSSCGLAVCWP
jgi:predicted O-methyltransferase YrrM